MRVVDVAVVTLLSLGTLPLSAAEAPARLSQTGLYADIGAKALSPDVRGFNPQYPLWSDGLQKSRWIHLPPGTKIDTSDPDRFIFPRGTKLWKEFRANGRLVETRY